MSHEAVSSEERHAGWLELFYDLLFVVLVAQLAHPLVEHPDWEAVLRLSVLFLPAWWVWIGSTIYTNLTGGSGTERRLDVLGQMAILVVMAGSATQAAHGHAGPFAGAYAASRIGVVIFRVLARGKWPAGGSSWPLLVSAALWIVSIPVHSPWNYLLWLAGLAIEAVPWLTRRRGGSAVRQRLAAGQVDISHIVERFGLFMIIVLGEAIAQIVGAIASADASGPAVLTGLSAFAVVAMLWWLYFDFGSAVAARTMNARPEEGFWLTRSIFLIGHLLPVVSLVALAAGLGGLVRAGAEHHHAGDALRLSTAALAVYLINNAIIGFRIIQHPLKRIATWLVPNLALLLALALLADHLIPAIPLLLIATCLAIETIRPRRQTA